MRSNYIPIGDYIRLVDERNKGLRVKQLLGLSISKQFIPSVANIIGTDMENYKIIRKKQFACSTMQVRRDKKMPVALLQEVDEAIISQAYPVFEVKDEKELLPEYLMMWFSREEFDREACFHAVGGVRGSLEWDDFCAMKFPLPSPEKQREIVAEYNTVKNRIELNKQLIQKLEETAQAIYKQWFVDFEFPDENGNPYRSSGGKMVWSEELGKEISEGWEVKTLGNIINYKKGNAFKSELYKEKGVRVVRVSDLTDDSIDITSCMYIDEVISQEFQKYELATNDIVITTVGSWPQNPASVVGKVTLVPGYAKGSLLNQNAVKIRAANLKNQLFIYYSIKNGEFANYVISGAQGSANQASVTLSHIFDYKIAMPEELGIIRTFFNTSRQLIDMKKSEILELNHFTALLLSKLATIED
ncbi:MAG: restriction endonuclease subunit S [Prolixibacteraceae bacterium]|nr:restriction endonuclease subunit S [Prolixibacteraceae bacterium]